MTEIPWQRFPPTLIQEGDEILFIYGEERATYRVRDVRRSGVDPDILVMEVEKL